MDIVWTFLRSDSKVTKKCHCKIAQYACAAAGAFKEIITNIRKGIEQGSASWFDW